MAVCCVFPSNILGDSAGYFNVPHLEYHVRLLLQGRRMRKGCCRSVLSIHGQGRTIFLFAMNGSTQYIWATFVTTVDRAGSFGVGEAIFSVLRRSYNYPVSVFFT